MALPRRNTLRRPLREHRADLRRQHRGQQRHRVSSDLVRPRGWFWDDADASPYGRTIFVHVPTRDVRVIRTPGECRRAVADFL